MLTWLALLFGVVTTSSGVLWTFFLLKFAGVVDQLSHGLFHGYVIVSWGQLIRDTGKISWKQVMYTLQTIGTRSCNASVWYCVTWPDLTRLNVARSGCKCYHVIDFGRVNSYHTVTVLLVTCICGCRKVLINVDITLLCQARQFRWRSPMSARNGQM